MLANGAAFSYFWKSDTQGTVTAISPDGRAEISAAVDLSGSSLISQAGRVTFSASDPVVSNKNTSEEVQNNSASQVTVEVVSCLSAKHTRPCSPWAVSCY